MRVQVGACVSLVTPDVVLDIYRWIRHFHRRRGDRRLSARRASAVDRGGRSLHGRARHPPWREVDPAKRRTVLADVRRQQALSGGSGTQMRVMTEPPAGALPPVTAVPAQPAINRHSTSAAVRMGSAPTSFLRK